MLQKQKKRQRRHKRIRAKVKGTAKVLRLCVFRSNRHIYAQLVDDEIGRTLVAASDFQIKSLKLKAQSSPKDNKFSMGQARPQPLVQNPKDDRKELTGKVVKAKEVGKLIAKKAIEKKIKKVVFDRGGYRYHGRVKALADGAREEGLKF